MFVIKRNVVLVRCDGGAAGFVRLECLRGKTEGEVKMRCPEGSLLEMMADGRYFSAPVNAPFNLPFALREDSRVAARIVKDGGVIALSSAAGKEFAARASAGGKKGEEERGQAGEKNAPERESVDEEKEKEQTGKKSALEKEGIEKNKEQAGGIFEKEERKQPQESPEAAKEEEREKSEGREVKTQFLGAISASLEELFSLYPAEERLAGVVPFSKWVRVPLESGYYVVGVISDQEGAARYLAYGVPDKDNASPPDAYPACRGWLPLEEDGAGYWMMYQDAITGEIVKK